MDFKRKLKKKNIIIAILSSILLVLLFLIMSILIFFEKGTYNKLLTGYTSTYVGCFDLSKECSTKLGHYEVNNKKYNIKAIYHPTSGVNGFGVEINGKSFYSSEHGSKSVELVDDKYFIVSLGEHLEIIDLELKELVRLPINRHQAHYNIISTTNNTSILEYRICLSNTLYIKHFDLNSLEDQVEYINIGNSDSRTKTYEVENINCDNLISLKTSNK